MRVAPIILFLISAPIFSFFLAPGALKGANTVNLFFIINMSIYVRLYNICIGCNIG